MKKKHFEDKKQNKTIGTSVQHFILGHSHLVKEDLDSAIKEYEKAVRLDSRNLKAKYCLAEACLIKARKDVSLPSGEKRELLKKAKQFYYEITTLSSDRKITQKAIAKLKNFKDRFTESK